MDEKQTKTQDNTLAIEIQNETPLETKDDIFDNKKEIENHKKSIDYIFVSHYMNDTHIYDTKYGPIHDDYVVTYSTEDKSFLGWLVNTEDNGPQQPDVTTYFPHDGEEDLSNVFSYVLCKKILFLKFFTVPFENCKYLFYAKCMKFVSSTHVIFLFLPTLVFPFFGYVSRDGF